jgi:hypothetical protein
MPIASLAITQANLVPGSNNSTYSYKFPISARFRDGDEVALSSANLFYSWFNISVDNNNNSFSYLWPTGSGTVTVDVNIPNGFYTAEDLNAYLQSVMVANSHYLIDGDGNYLYYLQLTTNSTLYPSTARTPQFVIPATDFRNIIGFDAGTYPSTPQLTSYSATSTFTPQITPVSSFNILCSLLNNSLSRPVNLLFNAAPNTTFGSQITVQQQFPIFQPIQPGTYNDIIIKFTDQNFNALPLQDSNISVILLVKTR